jgi:hypothetical protein
MEPTKDEIKNGWTKESLEKYHKVREEESLSIDKIFKPKARASVQVRYNPLKWRGE